jgi:hypothetical protein
MMRKIGLLDYKGNPILLFFLTLLVLFLPVALIIWQVIDYTHGTFMYPYDDTFIHLKIADNLAEGNWGISKSEFASASSSILYTLILAFARLFFKSMLVPLVVNCMAGILILISLHLWLRRHVSGNLNQFIIISLAILLTPLPLLIISGMEHTFQCLFSFLFIFYFSDWLEKAKSVNSKKLPVNILVFSVLITTIRYEGLFLIAIACILLLLHKKIIPAITLGIIAILPLVAFGLISLSKGNYFLPNSVLVKSGSFEHSNPLQYIYEILFDKLVYARNGMAALATQRLVMILPLLYIFFRKYLRPSYFFILVFLFFAGVLQLSFASTGYLYRYEAYLFFCFMIFLPLLFYHYGRQLLQNVSSLALKIAVVALAFFLFFPIVLRSTTALVKSKQGCINIYDQQYQMAMFTKKYYNQNAIALNDIGAVAYYSDAKVIDLWGLANIEVTRSKKQHYWTPEFLDSLCKSNQVQAAMVYDSWFPASLTERWNKVATWQIQNNVICGDATVSFYSFDSSSANVLQMRLMEYEPLLPSSVVVKYY